MEVDSSSPSLPLDQVQIMIQACLTGNISVIHELVNTNSIYASEQDPTTGQSPLMAASSLGNGALVEYLLENGAPWNAVDRQGLCAGDYATNNEHWGVVNLLVDWGVRSELILGMVERETKQQLGIVSLNAASHNNADGANGQARPVEYEPSTKPDYLRQRLQYTPDGNALLDSDQDAVMMEWERPLMEAHAEILMQKAKTVLNVGFGMGIIDTALQQRNPALHVIIEAHPDVYQHMLAQQWDKKPNVRICFGKWQDVLPQLIAEGLTIDAIFYDTYGEHYSDLEDFHTLMVQLLSKPDGVYSFFNGLAPDNLFFHGVACQCAKLQLSQLGLDSEFLPCEIQVKNEVWEGIRRKYWHGRDTYYLPQCTWNAHFLATGQVLDDPILQQVKKNSGSAVTDVASDGKRQRVMEMNT
ncbi:hypothetical protein MPSEU_000074000 [Mayamaea pseudoterrestris]|nr:hypothetical protein MPSEU_000074000 [Mayamaea pseudoterrestris]